MVPLLLLLLPLLWGGSLQQQPGYQYELRVQESVTVHESMCVSVSCSFSYPWSSWSFYSPVYTYWYRDGDNTNRDAPVASNNPDKPVKRETRGRFLFENARTNSCSLSITNARRSDAGRYFFRVERGDSVEYNYREKMLNLQVTDKPHIHIPEPLESGRPTELTCSLPGSCVRGQRFTFSWAGAAVDSLAPQTRRSSVLTFTPRPRDHGTNLSCQVQVQWPQLTTQRTIRLNVSYAPQNLTIGVSFRNATALKILQTTSLPILEGQALRLICVADSNPPAKLSWFWGSPGLNATLISSTSILELPRMGPAQEGEFTCQARNPLGSQSVCLSLSVVYPPQLLGPFCSWEDHGLHCSCSSRAQPAPSLRWRLGEGLLEGNHDKASHVVTSHWVGPWTNSSLSLCVGLSPDLRLSCEARNEHGVQSASALLLPGQGLLGAEAMEKRVGQREGGAGGGGLLRDRGDVRTGPTISCPSGSYSEFCKEVGRGETESWEWVVSPELVLEEQALSPCRPQHQGSRRAPRGAGGSGEFNLRDQHPLGSQHVSFSLSVQSSPHSSTCVTEEQQGSWPLVFTLIRGALMGAGFLLTYVLTWLYYTRCGGP